MNTQNSNPSTSVCFVGIDVSAQHLDVFAPTHPQARYGRFPNTQAGIQQLLRWLKVVPRPHLIFEASGGYELDLLQAAHRAGLPLSRVNPRQVRQFARALGRLAKTDRIDAQVLSQYGQAFGPKPQKPLSPLQRQLLEYVQRRTQLLQQRVQEQNRLHQTSLPALRQSLLDHIACLQKLLAQIEAEIHRLLLRSKKLRLALRVLTQIKGVGHTTAIHLLASVPELGRLNRRSIAALVGLAPLNQDSGRFSGQRRIWGGRAAARAALYMAALVASRRHPKYAAFYQRLLARGKPKKLALIAVMRRLLVHMNALLKPLATLEV